jgi:serine phosphatase RsbU (regulator of sigma subunit)
MKLMRTFVVVLISALSLISTNAQTKIKTEANADIVEYTNKDGLPSNNFSNIVQTNDGYLWFSGIEGTYRFNGYEFEEIGEKYGVPGMQGVYYDSTKNMLYFASPRKFITFDGERFKVYTEKEGYKINGLDGQSIDLLRSDSKGRIWIGSSTPFVDKKYNGGLTMFHNGKFTVYDSTTFPLHNAKNFIETPYGDLIFSSDGRNTQTKEGSYIALFKENRFKRIDESDGIYLQNPNIFQQSIVTSIDKAGNTWLAFSGINSLFGNNTHNENRTVGVLMYDGNKFHQYPELTKLLNWKTVPILVAYSNTLDKIFLTTATIEPTQFGSSNKNILEFDNGKWRYSDFFNEVKFATELNTNKKLTDFRYSATFLTKANKYFPELMGFISIANDQTQTSKYHNQFFTNEKSKWIKYDAFNGNPLREMKDGFLINTSKGFGIYYPNKSKMLTAKDGLLRTTSGGPSLYTDRKGIIWISYSYTQIPAYANLDKTGINIWDGKKLISYTEKDGLKSDISFEVFQDTKFRVWIPTAKGITVAREIKNSDGNWLFKFNNISSGGKKNYNVSNVFETKKGEIFAWQNFVRPTYGEITKADFYLGKYNGNKFIELESPFSDEDNSKEYQLISLKEGLDGNIWIEGLFANTIKDLTSVNTKILIYDGNNWSKPPEKWGIPDEQLHYVGTLKNGMYFLTVGGFYNFNGNRFINLSDSVDANADFRILKGASVAGTHTNIQSGERLYIRLRNRGLVIFDGKKLNFYTKKNGLPSANISTPMVDQKGNVTFGFPSGALVINGDKFQAFYDDENIATGGAYTAVKDINGDLAMFYNGLGLYIRKNEYKTYPLSLASLVIDTASYFYNFPQDLSYTENSLIFNFSALNFKDPRQTNYEYILEGYDKDWSRPGNLSFAQYQNLPHGKYTFRVKGITSNGVKTNEATYSFIIAPPFWKTWWAYIFYVLLVGFGLNSLRQYERHKMKLKEAERVRKERADARLREAELRTQLAESENDRKTKELEEARELQLSMLPEDLPNLPNLDIAVYMQTATEVGGDYYDFHVGMDGTLTVVVGDATGHGMKAGTMVTATKSLFNILAPNSDILATFSEISRVIKGMKFHQLSMCLMLLKIKGKELSVSSAAMPPALIYRKKNQAIEEIFMKGMPLGAMNNFPYTIKEGHLEQGDTILLLSDGLPELTNDSSEMYGYDRTKTEFCSVGEKEPEEIVDYLKNSAAQWVNGKAPDDDVTFVVIKVK